MVDLKFAFIGIGIRDIMDSSTGDNSSVSICAACGKAGDNLKACTSCKQVKYCNRNCQKLHWPKHKKECKHLADSSNNIDNVSDGINNINLSDSISASFTAEDKKTSKLYEQQKMVHVKNISDDELFREPPPKEDCPICMLPMPYANGVCGINMIYHPCCGKIVCKGCILAASQEMKKGTMKPLCAFCREPILTCGIESLTLYKKRMKLNDAEAYDQVGMFHFQGSNSLPKDYKKTLELWKKAAELGSLTAHYSLAAAYMVGNGVSKDQKLALHHYKLAAIGGHEIARLNLGSIDYNNNDGNDDRAMKHFMIAASCGYDVALKEVGNRYRDGYITKDEYASTLRAYQNSIDEMKSEQREAAKLQRSKSIDLRYI